MQAIYAYQQAQSSDYELAQDLIKSNFEPDLNAMEKQDKILLKKEAQIALQIFDKSYQQKQVITHTEANTKINHSVQRAIDFYYKSLQKDYNFYLKEMLAEVDNIYNHYLAILLWAVEISNIIATQRDKKSINPNHIKIAAEYQIADNRIIKIIADNEKFREFLLRKSISWHEEQDLLLDFVGKLKKNEKYQEYAQKEATLESDWEILDYIFREYLFKKTPEDSPEEEKDLQAFFEKKDINWSENREILKSMILKTLKKAKESPQNFELLELSQDWEADSDFFENLYKNTLSEIPRYEELLSKIAKNWKTERFVMLDKILIQMAIAEMLYCPSIPIKVTINEYIELAKNYSTPKSKNFINGMLNTLAEELHQQSLIKKTGRGLLDNQ
ncbi:MAG: transcription antitermination factor NusB [Thermonemataceae bacterium]|nr:transcription antitermination factor NusB [Thermonemataceae bacterium]